MVHQTTDGKMDAQTLHAHTHGKINGMLSRIWRVCQSLSSSVSFSLKWMNGDPRLCPRPTGQRGVCRQSDRRDLESALKKNETFSLSCFTTAAMARDNECFKKGIERYSNAGIDCSKSKLWLVYSHSFSLSIIPLFMFFLFVPFICFTVKVQPTMTSFTFRARVIAWNQDKEKKCKHSEWAVCLVFLLRDLYTAAVISCSLTPSRSPRGRGRHAR